MPERRGPSANRENNVGTKGSVAREASTQFVKFALVGVLNTALHYCIFLALFLSTGHYLVATTAGFSIAVVNSYLLNKTWTFRRKSSRITGEFLRFLIVSCVGLGLNLSGMLLLVETVHLPPVIAQALTIGVTLAVNFGGTKLWAFR